MYIIFNNITAAVLFNNRKHTHLEIFCTAKGEPQ